MARSVRHRRGTAAEWAAANPVLGEGEIGYVTDTREVRIGDGLTAWASLGVFNETVLSASYAAKGSVEASRITKGNLTVSPVMGRIPFGQAHAAFPGVIKAADGTLVVVFRGASGHVSTDGNGYITTSTDKGRTWTTPVAFVDEADDIRDPQIALLADGSWAVTYKSATLTPGKCKFIRSTDEGATWSAPVTIPFTFTGWDFVSAPVVQLSDDTLVVACYGKNSADDRTSIQTARSADLGATWTDVVTAANGVTDSKDYQEPNILVRADGTLRMFIRTENVSPYVISTCISSDGGLTWGAISTAFVGGGNPHVYRLPGTSTCAVVYRDQATGDAALRTSHDDGTTWASPHIFGRADNYMTYASLVEVDEGQVLCVWSREDSGTDARLHTTWLGAKAGISPLGGDIPSESLVVVDPRVQITQRIIPASTLQPSNGTPAMTAFASGQAAWMLDAATTEGVASFLDHLPPWWNTFNIAALVAPTGGGGGDVRLDVSYGFFGNDQELNGGTYVSGASNLHAVSTTALVLRTQTLVSGVVNDRTKMPFVRVLRAGADAGDTYGADLALVGLLLTQAS